MAKRRLKRKPLANKYSAKAGIEIHHLTKAGSAINLRIYGRNKKIGKLLIGRGALYWYGAHKQKPTRISWRRFADVMDQIAYG